MDINNDRIKVANYIETLNRCDHLKPLSPTTTTVRTGFKCYSTTDTPINSEGELIAEVIAKQVTDNLTEAENERNSSKETKKKSK